MTDRWGSAVLVLAALGASAVGAATAQDVERGKAVYELWCASCHGADGKGAGPGARYMLPRPRDFVQAFYQVRSTASGALPTDADLMRVIDDGVPGTAMPGWKTRLSAGDRRALVAYLKTFSPFFEGAAPAPLALGRAPGGGDEALRIGRQFYDSIGCAKCHGGRGLGDGPSAPTLEDDNKQPIFAADLSQNWRFNSGPTVEDIYRALRTGLDGTPMPSFSDLLEQRFLTDQELWHLARYVRSLSPARPPELRDVIVARRVAGAVPTQPDDSVWADADEYWFPVVGQIIRKSRWFAPAVADIRVRAVHDGETLALRLAWHDRSESPDTAWLEFAGKVLAAVASDGPTPPRAERWPDQVAVQFPRAMPQGMERPYFLMGSATEPVYQWRWRSAPRGVVEGLARGIERWEPQPAGAQDVRATAVYERGEWRLVLTRTLATADTANELQFGTGRAIPIALFVWDGSSGEHGSRFALTSWYYLALAEPTPLRVYVTPVVAALLTALLGFMAVRRAPARPHGPGRSNFGE